MLPGATAWSGIKFIAISDQYKTLAKLGLGVLQAGGNWEFGEREGHLRFVPDFSRCPVSFCD